jgi:pyridoxine 4-dehydrogenase
MTNQFAQSIYQPIPLGKFQINRIGLGTNRVTNKSEVKDFLKFAVESGVNFIDTAHVYSGGDSETTIGDTLTPYKDELLIATKGGMGQGYEANNSEAYLSNNLDTSLKRLKVEAIDLYQLHRLDTSIPISETMGILKQFQDTGKIRHIGLSEVTIKEIEEARNFVDIVSVQNDYSLTERKHDEVVEYCEENGIIFIPFFPLRGLSGNIKLYGVLKEMASEHGVSAEQIALAWLLKRSDYILPIPGTLSKDHLSDNIAATNITLSEEEYVILNQITRPRN